MEEKHLKSIYYNYKKAPFFKYLYPKIEHLYQKNFDLFSNLAYQHLIFWLSELNIKTKIVKSSELNINSKKSDLIWICVFTFQLIIIFLVFLEKII